MKKKSLDGLLKNDIWSSPFLNSLWSDTNETWSETPTEDWRIVGTNPFKKRSKSYNDVQYLSRGEVLYLVEFSSSRLELAYTNGFDEAVELGTHVIIEADRGEDCGRVVGFSSYHDVEVLRNKYGLLKNEAQVKKMYRLANKFDLQILDRKKAMEDEAFKMCAGLVQEMNLKMVLKGSEYQFDMNKLTFYYDSNIRIDFRDLVKELYKVYKTRIWMCSIEKSKNRYLRELL